MTTGRCMMIRIIGAAIVVVVVVVGLLLLPLTVLLILHSAVLKPDLNLALCQI